ncbi:MAG: 50S ribosomal protein L22 [Bacilli bacterium]|nr:50S ribosomal protein L22 [Bacilli bacterium]
MKAKATANTVLTAPIKSRLVIDLIRNKSVSEAANLLNNMNKKSARLINKVLTSAVANAENNLGLEKDKLYVLEAYINEGPVLKRIRFGSRSHIDRHDKRTSHITVVVGYKTK